jgi:hypothetical protein
VYQEWAEKFQKLWQKGGRGTVPISSGFSSSPGGVGCCIASQLELARFMADKDALVLFLADIDTIEEKARGRGCQPADCRCAISINATWPAPSQRLQVTATATPLQQTSSIRCDSRRGRFRNI